MMPDRPKSGYYWYYEYSDRGRRIQVKGTPDVLYYNNYNNSVMLLGSDYVMQYDPTIYQLLQVIEYQLLVANT